MSTIEQDGQQHEILIIRRPRHDEDEGHHGGVWKIAFADFMTALMCFFLVMWLINAANEETRAALASYFNPVKLIDRNASRKGLDEMGGPQSVDSAPENADDKADDQDPSGASAPAQMPKSEPSLKKSEFEPGSDEHLFSDPYAVLAEIAAETGTLQNTSSKGDGGAQSAGPASGASGGESYRDPFAPDFWSQQVDVHDATATAQAASGQAGQQEEQSDIAEADSDVTTPLKEILEKNAAEAGFKALGEKAQDATAVRPVAEPAVAAAETPAEREVKKIVAPPAEPLARPAEPLPPQPDSMAEAEREAEALRKELAEALADDEEISEGISVTATEDGVLISITDQDDFGMFEIGSAVPRRELILAMEKIGKLLGGREGDVVINGHTDGRPFRSATYDNWRLSTARAHSAYFMLVRGGLDELRIMEVAGYADRKLKLADDPFADANRRIEILLEKAE